MVSRKVNGRHDPRNAPVRSRPPPAPKRVRAVPPFRILLLAAAAVAVTLWAIIHAYTRARPPMLVPREPAAEPTEIPAPSVIPAP